MRTWIVGIILLTGTVGCDYILPSPEPEPLTPLTGKAYLAAPLDNATITVETDSGEAVQLSPDGNTSHGRFFKQLSLPSAPSELSANLPLTVKVTGGTVDGLPFDGTLLGYVASFSPDDAVHVNVLSTLIVKYRQATGVTPKQAEQAVVALLNVPADADLVNKLNDPDYWFLLDPTRFMTLAQAHGGFDAFSDQIVANMVRSQPLGASFTVGDAAVQSIASKAASWLLESTGEGLVAWGVGEAMDWVLSAFGYQSPTDKALSEIQTQLTQVNETLSTIQSEIGTLTNQMSHLLSLVQLSWDSLTSTISSLNMSSQENVIQNQYGNMLQTFTSDNPNLCTAAGNALAENFAQEILSAQDYDIDQQIYDMYANITGKNPGSNGALYDLTSKLADQIQDGQDPYNAYIALENYFGQLASIQAQGLTLMIEAINQPLDPMDGSGLTSYQGTATQYYNKFYSQMSDEVEVFLQCVDRLIVATIDVRSEIAQKTAYMSPETAAIYNRADFVANQLSTRQPSGLIVRLIGDPTYVSDWVTNHRIQLAGEIPDIVTVNNNNINNYPAVIPASTPNVAYYLEWTPDSKNIVYTCKKQTQVSVVKLHFAAPSAGLFGVSTPTEYQTLNVAFYNNDFQPASDTDTDIVSYGNGVFHVRTLPTWQAGTAEKTNDKHKQWTSSWTPDPQDASMTMYSQQTNPTTAFGSCPLTYVAGIKSTIQNGETGDLEVALQWNATEDTSISWTAGNGNPESSSKQSLKCQSTTQTAKNDTATTMDKITLTPNTATDIDYNAEHDVTGKSIYNNYVRQTYSVNTVAGVNSLEIVPTK